MQLSAGYTYGTEMPPLRRKRSHLTKQEAMHILGAFNPGAEYSHALVFTSSRGSYRYMMPRLKHGYVKEICDNFGITKSTLWRLLSGQTRLAQDVRTVLQVHCMGRGYERRPEIPRCGDGRKQWRVHKYNAAQQYVLRPLNAEEEADWMAGTVPPRIRQALLGWSRQQAELWCRKHDFDFAEFGWPDDTDAAVLPVDEREATLWGRGIVPQRIAQQLWHAGRDAIAAWVAKYHYAFSNDELAAKLGATF